jgi:uncharacterized membrane protein
MWQLSLSTATILLLAATPALAVRFTFSRIDAPYPGTVQTIPSGINNQGQVVGWYFAIATGLTAHGFVMTEGSFATFDFDSGCCTDFHDINNRGQVVGYGGQVSFLFESGQLFPFSAPGATATDAGGINDGGDIVGTVSTTAGLEGFLLRDEVFTVIRVPGAQDTRAMGINNAGDVVGAFFSSVSGRNHGFLLRDGRFSTVDFPGAHLTVLTDINNAGEMVGTYSDSAFLEHGHGFLVRAEGFYVVDFPGAVSTRIAGLNDHGDIVGTYADTDGRTHGFVATINVAAENVNNLLSFRDTTTSFDQTPVPNGPAGRFQIVARFDNTSGVDICYPLLQLVELSGGNELEAVWLDSDDEPIQGRGGAVLGHRPTMLGVGTTVEFRLVVDLLTPNPFTLFVNVWGTPSTPGGGCP